MVIKPEFEKWANSLVGCDGGDIRAPLYFSGIEWGIGSDPYFYPSQIKYSVAGIDFPAREDVDVQSDPNTTKHNFDQKIAKIILGLRKNNYPDMDYREYILKHYCRHPGDMFKFNLYPLSFKSHHDHRWDEKYYKLTGIPTKYQYRAWCAQNRFRIFRHLTKTYKPRCVICFGASYRNDFVLAFGGEENIFRKGEIKSLGEERKIEVLQIDESTHIVIAPFLSGASGLNSNAYLESLTDEIRRLL